MRQPTAPDDKRGRRNSVVDEKQERKKSRQRSRSRNSMLRANANMLELLKETNKDEFGLEFKKENLNRNNEQR